MWRHDLPTEPVDARCNGCGADVTEFRYLGLVWQLEREPLPITTDLRDVKKANTVWVFNSDLGNWASKFGFTRDWRETRAGHQCPNASTKRERRSA